MGMNTQMPRPSDGKSDMDRGTKVTMEQKTRGPSPFMNTNPAVKAKTPRKSVPNRFRGTGSK